MRKLYDHLVDAFFEEVNLDGSLDVKCTIGQLMEHPPFSNSAIDRWVLVLVATGPWYWNYAVAIEWVLGDLRGLNCDLRRPFARKIKLAVASWLKMVSSILVCIATSWIMKQTKKYPVTANFIFLANGLFSHSRSQFKPNIHPYIFPKHNTHHSFYSHCVISISWTRVPEPTLACQL